MNKGDFFSKRYKKITIQLDGNPIEVVIRPITRESLAAHTDILPTMFAVEHARAEVVDGTATAEQVATTLNFMRAIIYAGVVSVKIDKQDMKISKEWTEGAVMVEDLEDVEPSEATPNAYPNTSLLFEAILAFSNWEGLFRSLAQTIENESPPVGGGTTPDGGEVPHRPAHDLDGVDGGKDGLQPSGDAGIPEG